MDTPLSPEESDAVDAAKDATPREPKAIRLDWNHDGVTLTATERGRFLTVTQKPDGSASWVVRHLYDAVLASGEAADDLAARRAAEAASEAAD